MMSTSRSGYARIAHGDMMRARSLTQKVANPLPASFLRGGTSKGIFLKRSDLPESQDDWKPIFQGIMGSPDPHYRRQLNGMGGGVSSLSKICVVGPPSSAQSGVDVEYTFVQVGIEDGELDVSGNCGNLSSMIGVFALDEDLCTPRFNENSGLGTVRSYNTNTAKVIDTTFPLSSSHTADLERPEVEVAGVPGKASRIVLQFVDPGGARTGKLLPTGSPSDNLALEDTAIPASFVDATNPTVFIAAEHLAGAIGLEHRELTADHLTRPDVEAVVERIRQAGAVRMGLDPSAKAQPKIAILNEPTSDKDLTDGVDVIVHAFSMGVLHKAVPMTVGLCLGVAAGVKGTLAHDILARARGRRGVAPEGMVRIRHPGGSVDVGAKFGDDGSVLNAQVVRTGRRLMKGVVWW
ncbi:PrpF protein [Dichomitus squalens]|uniref:PrpF protein n=1 Tax=Dichomitus squalens TaxID=114155 RepID=A0A4Q9MZX8_9APHY|nr:PrpF protein [Dichomitus squalens]